MEEFEPNIIGFFCHIVPLSHWKSPPPRNAEGVGDYIHTLSYEHHLPRLHTGIGFQADDVGAG